MNNVDIIILAAGKGTRMKNDLPKVLSDLNGRPMISYLLDTVSKLPLSRAPLIVVGYKADMVKEVLGDGYRYAHQEQQLGTGHAVMCSHEALSKDAAHVVILYGDMPYVTAETLTTLINTHTEAGSALTMATTDVEDFNDWKEGFRGYGRVVRGEGGDISRIIEYRDASEDVRSITEVNPSYFCIERQWLFAALKELKNTNASEEYYLTDLAHAVSQEGGVIPSVLIDPVEALGANTIEQFEILKRIQHEYSK